MKQLLIILSVLLTLTLHITAKDFKIVVSPAFQMNYDHQLHFGGSLRAGIKKGNHTLGFEYTFSPQSSYVRNGDKERHKVFDPEFYGPKFRGNYVDVTMSHAFYGGGLFYMYDLFSISKIFTTSIGSGVGYWHEDLYEDLVGYAVEEEDAEITFEGKGDDYSGSMFLAPRLQFELAPIEMLGIFSSITFPANYKDDTPIMAMFIDTGISIRF